MLQQPHLATTVPTAPPVTDATPRADGSVRANMNFISDRNAKPIIEALPSDEGEARRARHFGTSEIVIHNARNRAIPANLEREGFALVRQESPLEDYSDEARIGKLYYPEMANLIKARTGASDVLVFDHTLRIERGYGTRTGPTRGAVFSAHNDYTAGSAPQRVRDLLSAPDAERRLARRFAIVNAWRPIRGPSQTAPLAVADAQSVPPEDLIAADLVYPDRTGEIYYLAFNSEHRWYYYPAMGSDEVLLIKGYDSKTDGRARFAPHGAFHDPATPPDAAPRESIEVRALVFFDHELAT